MSDQQFKIKAAYDAVKRGVSVRHASREYGVPRTTLRDKLSNKSKLRTKKRTTLTEEEENKFSKWIINMARAGFGKTRKDFLENVQGYLNQLKETTLRFKNNNKPGKSWYYSYLKRHEELTERIAHPLGFEKAIVTATKIETWFIGLEQYINENDSTLLNQPSRWYNCDESGFALALKSKKVLAPKSSKGDRHLYLNTTSAKTQITALCCMSATGHFVSPLVVMPGKRLRVNPTAHFRDCSVGVSESGWMTRELFISWLKNVFVPAVNSKCVKRPVLLFLDGSTTHKSQQASDFCLENGILLYCLQPNATHLIQPLDLSFFGSLKHHWGEAVMDYQTKNPGMSVTKSTFSLVFKTAYEKSCRPEVARAGFEKAGLFPFCKEAVLNTKKMEASRLLVASPTPYSSCPLSHTVTSPSLSTSVSHQAPSAEEKLRVLESFMSEEVRVRYERRLEEGYDLADDLFYNAWKECKESTNTTREESEKAVVTIASMSAEPLFLSHGRFPPTPNMPPSSAPCSPFSYDNPTNNVPSFSAQPSSFCYGQPTNSYDHPTTHIQPFVAPPSSFPYGDPATHQQPFSAPPSTFPYGHPTTPIPPFSSTPSTFPYGHPTTPIPPFSSTPSTFPYGHPTTPIPPFSSTPSTFTYGYPTTPIPPFSFTPSTFPYGHPTTPIPPFSSTPSTFPYGHPTTPIPPFSSTPSTFNYGHPTTPIPPFSPTSSTFPYGHPTTPVPPFSSTSSTFPYGYPTTPIPPFSPAASSLRYGHPTTPIPPFSPAPSTFSYGHPTTPIPPFSPAASSLRYGHPTTPIPPFSSTPSTFSYGHPTTPVPPFSPAASTFSYGHPTTPVPSFSPAASTFSYGHPTTPVPPFSPAPSTFSYGHPTTPVPPFSPAPSTFSYGHPTTPVPPFSPAPSTFSYGHPTTPIPPFSPAASSLPYGRSTTPIPPLSPAPPPFSYGHSPTPIPPFSGLIPSLSYSHPTSHNLSMPAALSSLPHGHNRQATQILSIPSGPSSISDTHISPTPLLPSHSVPPLSLDAYLKRGTPRVQEKKKKRCVDIVPNMALTSEECMQYFKRKDAAKLEAEKKKEERKMKQAERKRLQEEKKKMREEKRKEKETEKKRKCTNEGSQNRKRIRRETTREEDNFVDGSLNDGSELRDFVETIDENECSVCHGMYRETEANEWVGCNRCVRWFHKGCVTRIDFVSMSEEQLRAVEFFCDMCSSV